MKKKINTKSYEPRPKPLEEPPRWANSLLCFAVFLGTLACLAALACWWWVSDIMREVGK